MLDFRYVDSPCEVVTRHPFHRRPEGRYQPFSFLTGQGRAFYSLYAGWTLWDRVAGFLDTALVSSGSSFNFSNSWNNCVLNSMTKDIQDRTPTVLGLEARRIGRASDSS